MSTTLSKPVVDEGRRTGVASDSGDEWKGGGGPTAVFRHFSDWVPLPEERKERWG